MLWNLIKCTSVTGGTGALTLTRQSGFAQYSDAITGTRYVYYTIAEYSDSTKAVLVRGETGMGSVTGSVLTRSIVSTTFVSSTNTYLPNPGVSTQPTALSFGTTAANIDIACEPTSLNQLPAMPAYNNSGSGADGLGAAPLGWWLGSQTFTLTTGVVYYFPVWIAHMGPFSQASVRLTTSTTTAGSLTLAFYEFLPTGLPGKRLANWSSVSTTPTSPATISTTALTSPVAFPPGWYFQAMLYLVGSGSGSPTLRAYNPIISPGGISMANNGPVFGLQITGQTAFADPATAPTALVSGTTTVIPLVALQ